MVSKKCLKSNSYWVISTPPKLCKQTDTSKYLQSQSTRHRKLKLLFSKLGVYLSTFLGFPGGASGKESACQCRRRKRHRFDLWVRKIPWRRKWQPIPVFLPGKSHGQESDGLQSIGLQGVGHSWARTRLHFYSVAKSGAGRLEMKMKLSERPVSPEAPSRWAGISFMPDQYY